MPPLDNYSLSILALVNELGERFGLKPYDFVATVDHSPTSTTTLKFEAPPEEKSVREKFERMLDQALPLDTQLTISGSEERIYEVLVAAIKKSPARGLGR